MDSHGSAPKQASYVVPSGSYNWKRIALAIVITALLAGTGGYLLGTNQSVYQRTKKTVAQPTRMATPSSPTSDPTATWKTYINDQYEYQANYPQELVIEDHGVNVIFKSKSQKFLLYTLLTKNANPKRETINKDWIENYLAANDYYKSVGAEPQWTFDEIFIDGKRAVKVIERLYPYKDSWDINLYIPRDTDILEVHIHVPDNPYRYPERTNGFISTFVSTFKSLN
jgi:hypothetical protein